MAFYQWRFTSADRESIEHLQGWELVRVSCQMSETALRHGDQTDELSSSRELYSQVPAKERSLSLGTSDPHGAL